MARRVNPRGDDTRQALVETAERLFAERGIESVSLRDVCAAAGQRNHSAAQYHFGDRAGLVGAVFEHRMRHVNDRRHAMLDALGDAGGAAPLSELVRTLVEPLAAIVAETGGWYGRFLARTQWDAFAREVVSGLPVLSSFRRATSLVVAHLGHLPREVVALRLDQVASLLIGTIAGWEWQRHRAEPAVPLAALQADLTTTLAAVLSAPAASPELPVPAELPVPSTAASEART
jgi:AcrR family transcriptional regulator